MLYNILHREEKEKVLETQNFASLPFYGEIPVGKIIDSKVF